MAAQIYAYTVCVVAVITFLISATSIVNAILDMGDPIHSGYTPQGTPSLASYENYKMDVLKSTPKTEGNSAYYPDEQTLKAMYESARNDKVQSVLHQSRTNIITAGLSLVIAVILFLTHWMWVRKFGQNADVKLAAA